MLWLVCVCSCDLCVRRRWSVRAAKNVHFPGKLPERSGSTYQRRLGLSVFIGFLEREREDARQCILAAFLCLLCVVLKGQKVLGSFEKGSMQINTDIFEKKK